MNANKFFFLSLILLCVQCSDIIAQQGNERYIQFIYASDSHYGLFREFRGNPRVSSGEVNQAMLKSIQQVQQTIFPEDGGVRSGELAGGMDFVVNTGEIANRMEEGVQTAAASWEEFEAGWIQSLTVCKADSTKAPLYLLPGNHDVSNAIGYTKNMIPRKDPTALVEIYNRMMKPVNRQTNQTYSYSAGRVNYSFDIKGIHFAFVGMWPDSQGRKWLTADLQSRRGPCLLFTHDEPDVEAKHLTNPNGNHRINSTDKFENLLSDTGSVRSVKLKPLKEHRELAAFIKSNPSIKAYFHGNSNWNEFYVWKGPDNNIALPVFRVDSPMKGEISSTDESALSFQVAVIDVLTHRMTVRECLWNKNCGRSLVWGESKTISW